MWSIGRGISADETMEAVGGKKLILHGSSLEVDVVHKSKGMILKITCISLSISRYQLFGSFDESSHRVGSANCHFHPIGLDDLTLGGVDGSAMHQFFGTLDTAL